MSRSRCSGSPGPRAWHTESVEESAAHSIALKLEILERQEGNRILELNLGMKVGGPIQPFDLVVSIASEQHEIGGRRPFRKTVRTARVMDDPAGRTTFVHEAGAAEQLQRANLRQVRQCIEVRQFAQFYLRDEGQRNSLPLT